MKNFYENINVEYNNTVYSHHIHTPYDVYIRKIQYDEVDDLHKQYNNFYNFYDSKFKVNDLIHIRLYHKLLKEKAMTKIIQKMFSLLQILIQVKYHLYTK